MSFGIGAGLKGLNAARLQMQIAGHNISNLSTPGYSRQRALLGAAFPISVRGFQIGTGVEVDDVQQILDGRLDSRIRTQMGLYGGAEIDYRRMTEIEGIMGEPSSGGVSDLLNSFFGAASKLRTDAASRALRGGLVQEGKALASGLNLVASRLDGLATDTFKEVGALVNEVNQYANTIAALNKDIVTLEANGSRANDMRDRREQAIKSLAEIMDTQVLERKDGVTDILAGGYLLVSGSRTNGLSSKKDSNGYTQVHIGNSSSTIQVREGKIAALLQSEQKGLPGLQTRFDKLAKNLALEFNRIHTTGLPKSGPFTSLVSEYAAKDGDGDGQFSDELLGYGGLPFDIQKGDLYVAVTNSKTGNLERTKISIDPNTTTLGDLASQLDSIPHLSSSIDPTGRLRINAEDNYGFDFSSQLDATPNSAGTMSGINATIGGSAKGPFDFSTLPASFNITVDGGTPKTITLTSSDFAVPSAVPAKELASVLDSKFSAAGAAANAVVVGNNISLKTSSNGTSSSLQLTDGSNSPLATLGLKTGVTATGKANPLAVSIMGNYSGSTNGYYRFVPEGDGDIGVTAGLTVGVFDQDGVKVQTLNVGLGYSHGDKLEVADGVQVSFGPGTISASNGEQFALDTLSDSDTTDALVALGLNTFFTGSTAADLGVSDRISSDPDLFAAALKANQGDGANLARISALRELSLSDLGENTIEGYYTDTASEVGFETQRSTEMLKSQDELLTFLEDQREAVSGVNIDEEMVNLVKYQEAFQASSRFISMMSDMSQVLINIGR